MKRVFGTMWATAAVVLGICSTIIFVRSSDLSWLGVAIASLSVPVWLGVIVAKKSARTSAVPSVPLVTAFVGLVLSAAAWPAIIPMVLAVAIVTGHLVYFFWYSVIDSGSDRQIRVGHPLPSFEVENPDGTTFSSAQFAGSPAVLLFFRGNWCPLCVAQISEIADQYRELEARGVTVALISPQSPSHTRDLAERFDAPMTFLVDRDLRAARALGIFHEGGVPFGFGVLGFEPDTVLPTVVVVGDDGNVRFAEQSDNYRVRPDPSTFLAALNA